MQTARQARKPNATAWIFAAVAGIPSIGWFSQHAIAGIEVGDGDGEALRHQRERQALGEQLMVLDDEDAAAPGGSDPASGECGSRGRRAPSYPVRPTDVTTTTTAPARNAVGSQCTTPEIRSLTGFGPKTPKPSWSANSRTA